MTLYEKARSAGLSMLIRDEVPLLTSTKIRSRQAADSTMDEEAAAGALASDSRDSNDLPAECAASSVAIGVSEAEPSAVASPDIATAPLPLEESAEEVGLAGSATPASALESDTATTGVSLPVDDGTVTNSADEPLPTAVDDAAVAIPESNKLETTAPVTDAPKPDFVLAPFTSLDHEFSGGDSFINQGLCHWEQRRAQWLRHRQQEETTSVADTPVLPVARTIDVDQIIDLLFYLPKSPPEPPHTGPPYFPAPVPLPQMVDILQDLWEAEGIDP
jgi:hypothetical protein